MKPSKEMASRPKKDIDLKQLWARLGKEPPGPIVDSPRRESKSRS